MYKFQAEKAWKTKSFDHKMFSFKMLDGSRREIECRRECDKLSDKRIQLFLLLQQIGAYFIVQWSWTATLETFQIDYQMN